MSAAPKPPSPTSRPFWRGPGGRNVLQNWGFGKHAQRDNGAQAQPKHCSFRASPYANDTPHRGSVRHAKRYSTDSNLRLWPIPKGDRLPHLRVSPDHRLLLITPHTPGFASFGLYTCFRSVYTTGAADPHGLVVGRQIRSPLQLCCPRAAPRRGLVAAANGFLESPGCGTTDCTR